jgi:hypothetical protein
VCKTGGEKQCVRVCVCVCMCIKKRERECVCVCRLLHLGGGALGLEVSEPGLPRLPLLRGQPAQSVTVRC